LIEQRFGRWASTFLLSVIFLGVASLMGKLFVENFVWPLAMAIRGITELASINWRDVAEMVLSISMASVILSASGWILYIAFRWWLTSRLLPKFRKERQRTEELTDKVVAIVGDAKKVCDSCSYIKALNEHVEADHKGEAKEHEHQEDLQSFAAGLEETSRQLAKSLSSLRDDAQ